MSETAAWSYTNTATIYPFASYDSWVGETVYGEPYEIKCTWIAETAAHTDAGGKLFNSNFVIFTEDARPKELDLIQLSGYEERREIKLKLHWDMSFFGEKPDYKLVV